jgi:hypothetical protein
VIIPPGSGRGQSQPVARGSVSARRRQPATGPGRRAFIGITPILTPADAQACDEGWKLADTERAFRLQHWDYDGDRISGFDYDIGAILIRTATPASEHELNTMLDAWQLHPDQFLYPWQTDDPT